MTGPRPGPTSVDVEAVLAAFGIGPATVSPEPSLVSVVVRVSTEMGDVFLKEHPASDAAHLSFADTVARRLGQHGIRAPRLLPATTGESFARLGDRLYTLAAAVPGRPLERSRLRDTGAAERVARFAAEVHRALGAPPALATPKRPALWHDGDHQARAAAARHALARLPVDPDRDALVAAATLVEQQPAMQRPLDAVAEPQGVVHGDLWPGNVLTSPNVTELAVLDLESACRAPVLLDVAHFVDLAFREPGNPGRLDVARATAFARTWVAAAELPGDVLARLPDMVLAARGCSLLWTAERHLAVGSNPLDPLVADDVARVEHVLAIRERWAEELCADPKAAVAGRGVRGG